MDTTTTIILHLSLGPLLFLIGILTKKYPPKTLNGIYGYRTPRSMKTQATWDAANKLSTEILFKAAIFTMIIQALSYLSLSPINSILVSSAALTLGIIAVVFLTEKHLKTNFDKNGNPL